MKIKKKYIILSIIFVVYVIVMFLIFGRNYIRNNLDNGTMIISPNSIWKFQKGKWEDVDNNQEYSMKTYKTYENGTYIGDYQITYNDKFYLFDNKRNPINYENDLIAIRGTIDIGVVKFENTPVSVSDKVIYNILKEKQIKATSSTIRANVVKIDLDNDNKLEEIYVISNVFEADEKSNSFSIVAVKDNNKIKYLREEVRDSSYTLSMCNPYVQNIVDIDNDKKLEIITGCSYYSDGDTCHTLYNSNYEVIKTC